MKTDILKRIIISQQEEVEERFTRGNIIQRRVDHSKLLSYLREPNILAITGIRRCGKSVLSWQLLRKQKGVAYINFDDERLINFTSQDCDSLLEAFYELYGEFEYLILDEIQNIEGWELFANRLRRTKKLIITGSNSRLLSGELSTHLTGRYMDFTLMPFSFIEYCLYKGVSIQHDELYSTQKIGLVKKNLEEYLKEGGFPEVYQLGREMLLRIYSDIIEKDILQRKKIKKKTLFKDVSRYCIASSSQEFTFNRLKKIFSLNDVNTVKNWISFLNDSFLIFMLERFSFKLKEQMLAPKKMYCVDTGLFQMIGFQLSNNKGYVLENAVALELKRRKSYFDPFIEIYYWKDYNDNEVDFVLKKGKEVVQLIQVCYSIDELKTREREFKALSVAKDELHCDDLLIITWDTEATEEYKDKKITIVPMWKWLLSLQDLP
ncbi:MAG: ATP-binding protein [Spirochaetota bacterium]